MYRAPISRQYAAILLFAAAYLCLGWFVRNSYYQLMMTLVLIWATAGVRTASKRIAQLGFTAE